MPDSSHINKPPCSLAAIDLGSNSFHMIVVKIIDDQIQIIDQIKEMVRLGEGLTEEKQLRPEVRLRALACLERFGQRLRNKAEGSVRAVGTNTFRQIRDPSFLKIAQQALGHPIEVIAGREEARLVYLGVAHGLATKTGRRLVVDIGGGSTELIIGEGFKPIERESLHMGCVTISRRFFADGLITEQSMEEAIIACSLELRPVRAHFNKRHWRSAVGSSGSIKAIREVVINAGWSDDGITLESLERLKERLIEVGSIQQLQLRGLSDERQPVFVGGVVALLAVFRSTEIERMHVSSKALREGLIYEMLGRIHHEDVRQLSVHSLGKRFNIDEKQVERVDGTVMALFDQVSLSWMLNDPEYAKILGWAAHLHEIGLTIAHSQFHKHGAYLVENADLSGFTRQELAVLAALIRGHRRKFPLEVFEALPSKVINSSKQLCILLRLAALLRRSRSASARPNIRITVQGDKINLRFTPSWLNRHPLTHEELKYEQAHLKEVGFELNFK
ncbi:MAG: Ppx/GppA family phosphatase [Candidatus Polarisedimenticolaceae bacterium]|nr:Ppx/GppA family phosphatase [Candidatus Polarisedimenticolaceae bacterium]